MFTIYKIQTCAIIVVQDTNPLQIYHRKQSKNKFLKKHNKILESQKRSEYNVGIRSKIVKVKLTLLKWLTMK